MKTIKTIERPSLRDQIYDSLKQAIITLELEPGQRILDKDLAAEFGVSRTPVREALRKLEDEGLVESLPGSRTQITKIDVQEAKNAFTVVAALNALAARLAISSVTEKELSQLKESNKQLEKSLETNDALAAVEADDQFHQVLLDASGNPEIVLALERIMPKVRRLEFSKFSSVNGKQSIDQHNEIIRACETKDSQRIGSLVEENWLSLGNLLFEGEQKN